MLAPPSCLRTSRPSCAPVNTEVKAGPMCRSVQAARYVTRTEGGGLKSVTWNFVAERATGIGPALSAWELACHVRLDHEIAGHRNLSTCLLLSALTPCLPLDRARGGHAFELPLRRSSRVLGPTA